MTQQQQGQEIEIPEQPPAAPGGADFGKILQWAGVLTQIVATLDGIQNLNTGDEQELGEVKFRRGGKSYTLDLGTLTRTA